MDELTLEMINSIFSSEKLEELFKLLKNKKNIVIIGHKSPDGDSVGSCLALKHYLTKKGISSSVMMPDAFPSFLNWMKDSQEMFIYENNREKSVDLLYNADVIFTLDFNDQKRVGEFASKHLINSPAVKIMIDHHQEPKDYAKYTFSDVNACSTAQLVYEFIEANNDLDLIDEDIAACIYTGIVTDSGSFRFSSTTPKTHEIAGKLIELGLNHSKVHELIYDVNTIDRLNLLGYTLNEKLEVLEDIGVAIISLTTEEMKRFNTLKGYTEGFVNYALSIQGVKIAVFVKEDTNMVKISFRSKGDIPVNEFSKKYFEGGGHINAAGGRCNLSVDETVNSIKEKIQEFSKKYV